MVGPADDERWRDDAACADVPTAVFYPDEQSHWAPEAAKAVCADCDVQPQCLDFALRWRGTFGRFGVWGGLTVDERERLQRRRRYGESKARQSA